MMVSQDSDDYELMPRTELDDLRREVSSLKKNSMSEGDKARVLIESMDRLTISINRLITILDDAQKDIIEEYQQAKPAEKLNQILEQNDTIARALVAMHENLNSDPLVRNVPSQVQQPNMQQPVMQQSNVQQYGAPQPVMQQPPISPNLPLPPSGGAQNNAFQRSDRYQVAMQSQNPKTTLADNPYSMMAPSMPPMEDISTIDNLPPLDNPVPSTPRKKFLGIM